jgi:hypothetical protein
VDGTEYIAVQSGWGVDAARIQDGLAKANLGIEDNCRKAASSGCLRRRNSGVGYADRFPLARHARA